MLTHGSTVVHKIKMCFIFPVAFVYVMCYLMYFFLKYFLGGNHVEYVLQILFVKIQNRLDKLIYRSSWFAPFVYIAILVKIWFALRSS